MKRGDCVENFEQVYAQYYDMVYQYILSLCKDKVWAEEITQETFFKALNKIDNFRGECKLYVWLCQIAKNTFYTEIKKQKRQTSAFPLDTIPAQDMLEKNIFDKADALHLHKVLHTLDAPYQEVFWMRTFGELSFKEIGFLFEKTESWARVTYHRAKMKIKEGIL